MLPRPPTITETPGQGPAGEAGREADAVSKREVAPAPPELPAAPAIDERTRLKKSSVGDDPEVVVNGAAETGFRAGDCTICFDPMKASEGLWRCWQREVPHVVHGKCHQHAVNTYHGRDVRAWSCGICRGAMRPNSMSPVRPLVPDSGVAELPISEFIADRRVVTPIFHSEGALPGRYRLDVPFLLNSIAANVALVGEHNVRLLMVAVQQASLSREWGEDIVSGTMRDGSLTVQVRRNLANRLKEAQLARARSEALPGSPKVAEVSSGSRKRKDPEEQGGGAPSQGDSRQGKEPRRRRVTTAAGGAEQPDQSEPASYEVVDSDEETPQPSPERKPSTVARKDRRIKQRDAAKGSVPAKEFEMEGGMVEVFRDAYGNIVVIIEFRKGWTAWFQYVKWFIHEVRGAEKTDQWLVPPGQVDEQAEMGRWPAELVDDLKRGRAKLARVRMERGDGRSPLIFGVGQGPQRKEQAWGRCYVTE